MRPRLTWKVPSWTKAGWVDSHPAIVARFGPDAAGVVIRVRRMVEYRRDQPRSQDTRHTLQAIALSPESVDVRMLDDHADAVLTDAAWRLRQVLDLRELTAADLAECARQALAVHEAQAGRPETDDLALMLVAAILKALPAEVPPAERDQCLAEALRACGLAYGTKTVERLRTKAGQVF